MDPVTIALLAAGVTGGANMAGNYMSNQANANMNSANMEYNAWQGAANRQFNAQEAAKSRVFSSDEAQRAREFALGAARENQSFTAGEADKARSFNAQQAQLARDYTTMMSNSAYQRQVADMKAAGLNPIMAAYRGGGADTPSGSAASGPAASASAASSSMATPSVASSSAGSAGGFIPSRNVLEGVMSAAKDAAMMMPENKVKQEQGNTQKEMTAWYRDQAGTARSTSNLQHKQAEKVIAEKEFVEAQTRNAESEQGRITLPGGLSGNPVFWWRQLFGAGGSSALGPAGIGQPWQSSTAKGIATRDWINQAMESTQ